MFQAHCQVHYIGDKVRELTVFKIKISLNTQIELVYLINCEEYSREGKSTVFGVKLPYILGKTNDDDSLLHIIYKYMSAAIQV